MSRTGARRIGLFGGTFDPPHFGHLALAEWARTTLGLERVWFVPAGEPPHKRRAKRSPVRHRVAMTRLAVRGNAAFAVSTLESARPGPSYTADTVRAFAAEHPRARLHLLMGADMFATFDTWREPEEIARRCVLVVALRPGARARRSAGAGVAGAPMPRTGRARSGRGVVWLENPGLEVSSTALRERAREGQSLRYLVPDAVASYAERHRLYGPRRAARARGGQT